MANGTVGKTQQTAVCEKRMSHTMLQQKQQAMHSNKYPKNESVCVSPMCVRVCVSHVQTSRHKQIHRGQNLVAFGAHFVCT